VKEDHEMKDLLIHTSDKLVDILKPNKVCEYDRPCICFALNQFISYFGEYIYLFDMETLEENFFIKIIPTKGVEAYTYVSGMGFDKEYRYSSQPLKEEFRIYESIDLKRYCLGIISNFNYLKGVLETRLSSEIIKREEIDLSKEGVG